MVIDELKLIFIHINKTAGSSIETAFNQPLDHRWPNQIISDIGIEKWNSYFKFAIVRNPWDRFVSMYHFRQHHHYEPPKPFKQFMLESLNQTEKVRQPQVEWITDENGNIIIDFVARFENLQHDFEYVCQKVGYQASLPHINKAEHRRHYSLYYDDELLKLTTEYFAPDIEKFGYSFVNLKL